MIETTVMIHKKAVVEQGANIGRGSRVWAFAHILPGALIGEDCNICDHTFIENEVVIGNRVTIKCGVYLWDGVQLQDDVFIGPNVTFTNDKLPRSKKYPQKWEKTIVEVGASIGGNATILPGIRIGRKAMVGAGSVVTNNVPPNAKVVGNPGRIIGYVNTASALLTTKYISDYTTYQSKVCGVKFLSLPDIKDLRGNLSVAEVGKHLPFKPQRYFLVYDVPSTEIRGEHAHKRCHQFLVCVKGQVAVVVDDGQEREEFLLDRPHQGIYLPPMVWGIQYKYSSDAVLLVLASEHYDSDDYFRDYSDFLKGVNK